MSKMDMSKEQLNALLDYCPATGVFRWKVKASSRSPAGSVAGTKNKAGYIVFRLCGGSLQYAHRLAWLYVYGELPTGIDHIDGIRDNNAITNLRPANQSENNQNRCVQRKGRQWPIGVGFYARYGKWTARISLDKRERFLGYFDSPDSAHAAYLAAKQSIHAFNPVQREALQ